MIDDNPTSKESLLFIMREPFIDKLPGARVVAQFFAQQGLQVELLVAVDNTYLRPSFITKNINLTAVLDRSCNPTTPFPTSVRMLWQGIKLSFSKKPLFYVGIGLYGMFVAFLLSKLFFRPFMIFCCELPEPRHRPGGLTLLQRLEHVAYRHADHVIIQDAARGAFIAQNCQTDADKFLALPNSPEGKSSLEKSRFLQEKLQIGSDKETILLHSGGFGAWFQCREIIAAAAHFPPSWQLVFHTSYRIQGEDYFQSILKEGVPENVLFSIEPLPATQLDALISSSHIGLAFYSLERLGHRGELMGLASGKIAHFLKCGIPVIATDIPSIRAYVEPYGCGICVASPADIPEAVKTIRADYSTYQKNAIRCFDAVWHSDLYLDPIRQAVQTYRQQ